MTTLLFTEMYGLEPVELALVIPITNVSFADTASVSYLIRDGLFGAVDRLDTELSQYFMQTCCSLEDVELTYDYLKIKIVQHVPSVPQFATILRKLLDTVYFPRFNLGTDSLHEFVTRINENQARTAILQDAFKKGFSPLLAGSLNQQSILKFLDGFWKSNVRGKKNILYVTAPHIEYQKICEGILKDFISIYKGKEKIRSFTVPDQIIQKIPDLDTARMPKIFKTNCFISTQTQMNFCNISFFIQLVSLKNVLLFNVIKLFFIDWLFDVKGPFVQGMMMQTNQAGDTIFNESLFKEQHKEYLIIDGTQFVIVTFQNIPEIFGELFLHYSQQQLKTNFINTIKQREYHLLMKFTETVMKSCYNANSLFQTIFTDTITSAIDQYQPLLEKSSATDVYGPLKMFSRCQVKVYQNYWSCLSMQYFNKLKDELYDPAMFDSKFLSLYAYLSQKLDWQDVFEGEIGNPVFTDQVEEAFVAQITSSSKQEMFPLYVCIGQQIRSVSAIQKMENMSLFVQSVMQQFIQKRQPLIFLTTSLLFNPSVKIVKLLQLKQELYLGLAKFYQYKKDAKETFDYSKTEVKNLSLLQEQTVIDENYIEVEKKQKSELAEQSPAFPEGLSAKSESKFKKELLAQLQRFQDQISKYYKSFLIQIINNQIVSDHGLHISASNLQRADLFINQHSLSPTFVNFIKNLTDEQYQQLIIKYDKDLLFIQVIRNEIIIPIQLDQVYSDNQLNISIQLVFSVNFLPLYLRQYIPILLKVIQRQFSSKQLLFNLEPSAMIIRTVEPILLCQFDQLLQLIKYKVFGMNITVDDLYPIISDIEKIQTYTIVCQMLQNILFTQSNTQVIIHITQFLGKSFLSIINSYRDSLLSKQINQVILSLSQALNNLPQQKQDVVYQLPYQNYFIKLKTNSVDKYQSMFHIRLIMEPQLSQELKQILYSFVFCHLNYFQQITVLHIDMLNDVIIIFCRGSISGLVQVLGKLVTGIQLQEFQELQILLRFLFLNRNMIFKFNQDLVAQAKPYMQFDSTQIQVQVVGQQHQEQQLHEQLKQFSMSYKLLQQFENFSTLTLSLQYQSLSFESKSQKECVAFMDSIVSQSIKQQSAKMLQSHKQKLSQTKSFSEDVQVLKLQLNEKQKQVHQPKFGLSTQQHFQLIKIQKQMNIKQQITQQINIQNPINIQQKHSVKILIHDTFCNSAKKNKVELQQLRKQQFDLILDCFCNTNAHLFIMQGSVINGFPIDHIAKQQFQIYNDGDVQYSNICNDTSITSLNQNIQAMCRQRFCFPLETGVFFYQLFLHCISIVTNHPIKYNACLSGSQTTLILHNVSTYPILFPFLYNAMNYSTDIHSPNIITITTQKNLSKQISKRLTQLLGRQIDEDKILQIPEPNLFPPNQQFDFVKQLLYDCMCRLVYDLKIEIDKKADTKYTLLELLTLILRDILTERKYE